MFVVNEAAGVFIVLNEPSSPEIRDALLVSCVGVSERQVREVRRVEPYLNFQ